VISIGAKTLGRWGALEFKHPGQSGMQEAKLAKHFKAMLNPITPVRVTSIEVGGANDALRDR
jgi:hypothetical protein